MTSKFIIKFRKYVATSNLSFNKICTFACFSVWKSHLAHSTRISYFGERIKSSKRPQTTHNTLFVSLVNNRVSFGLFCRPRQIQFMLPSLLCITRIILLLSSIVFEECNIRFTG